MRDEDTLRVVYLDTSYLSELARIRRLDSARFAEFMRWWTSNELALAFSTVHMRETVRYGGRGERFELLQELLPIATDLPLEPIEGPRPWNVAETEVLRALAQQGRIVLDGPDDRAKIAHWFRIWTTVCRTAAESKVLSLYDQDAIQLMESAVYSAQTTGAKASNRPPGTKYERRRLSDMDDHVWTPAEAANARAQMLSALDDPEMWTGFPWVEMGLSVEEGKAATIALIDQMLEQVQSLGPKGVYLKQLGIKNSERFENTFTDDLIEEWWFDNSVREVVAKCARGNAELCEEVVGLNLLPCCPGSWLRARVAVEIRKAVPRPEPNHEYDLAHLSYLPYVDAFFCDREMAQLTRQVLRRQDVPASIKGMRLPLSPALDIESIQQSIGENCARQTGPS